MLAVASLANHSSAENRSQCPIFAERFTFALGRVAHSDRIAYNRHCCDFLCNWPADSEAGQLCFLTEQICELQLSLASDFASVLLAAIAWGV